MQEEVVAILDDFIGEISQYAFTKFSKTLAESVTDYMVHSEQTTPLVKAIWKELKRSLK